MTDVSPAAREEGSKGVKAMYTVFDMNQRGKDPRRHDIIIKMYDNGIDPETVTYPLYSEQATEMEMQHAMKFLCDAAFKVIAPNGNRIMPVERIDVSKPITVLADDEIVVKFNELSRESLFRRVKVMPGSEDIGDKATIIELAEFCVAWRKRMRGMTQGERQLAELMAADGLVSGTMSPDELKRMFPTQKAA